LEGERKVKKFCVLSWLLFVVFAIGLYSLGGALRWPSLLVYVGIVAMLGAPLFASKLSFDLWRISLMSPEELHKSVEEDLYGKNGSKVKKLAKEMGVPYIPREVANDNNTGQ